MNFPLSSSLWFLPSVVYLKSKTEGSKRLAFKINHRGKKPQRRREREREKIILFVFLLFRFMRMPLQGSIIFFIYPGLSLALRPLAVILRLFEP